MDSTNQAVVLINEGFRPTYEAFVGDQVMPVPENDPGHDRPNVVHFLLPEGSLPSTVFYFSEGNIYPEPYLTIPSKKKSYRMRVKVVGYRETKRALEF